MPTKKPRIVVTLDEDVYQALIRYSVISKQSVSSTVSSVLSELEPVFLESARLLESTEKVGFAVKDALAKKDTLVSAILASRGLDPLAINKGVRSVKGKNLGIFLAVDNELNTN